MTTARLLPALQVGLRARPVHLGCGCGVGGHIPIKLKKTTGGWGGQSPPIPSVARSVSSPHDPTVWYLRFAQMIYRQAGTPIPHPVTGGYIFNFTRTGYARFIEIWCTKVPCLYRTNEGFHLASTSLIISSIGGFAYERD